MKSATANLALFIVIVLCGYVVANGAGLIKVAGFTMGIVAAGLSIYIHWKNKNKSNQ